MMIMIGVDVDVPDVDDDDVVDDDVWCSRCCWWCWTFQRRLLLWPESPEILQRGGESRRTADSHQHSGFVIIMVHQPLQSARYDHDHHHQRQPILQQCTPRQQCCKPIMASCGCGESALRNSCQMPTERKTYEVQQLGKSLHLQCCIFFQRRLGSDRKQCFPVAFGSLALHSSKKRRMRRHITRFPFSLLRISAASSTGDAKPIKTAA